MILPESDVSFFTAACRGCDVDGGGGVGVVDANRRVNGDRNVDRHAVCRSEGSRKRRKTMALLVT